MTPIKFVRQLSRIDTYIMFAEENLQQLEADLTRLGAIGYERSYNPNRATEGSFVKIIEKKMEVEERVKGLISTRQQILDAIYNLEDSDERVILLHRYKHNRSWRERGREMYMDHKTVMRKHDEGLSHLKF